jgi:hypothetical protein
MGALSAYLSTAVVEYASVFLLLVLTYGVIVAIYRVTFHPLAHIPGPKLAAVTQFYQTYYCYANDRSRFYKVVEELHKIYGMGPLKNLQVLKVLKY